jgi:hypothetical protein
MSEQRVDRETLMKSLDIMSEYHWIFLRHLYRPTEQRFGAQGLDTLAAGLRAYGFYRGEKMRDNPHVISATRNAATLVRYWDGSELALASLDGPVNVEGDHRGVDVALSRAPGMRYFEQHPDDVEALSLHWREVIAGIAEGFEDGAIGAADDALATPWHVRFTTPAASEPTAAELPPDAVAAPARYIQVGRRATGLIAALQFYTARALVQAFDASGEEAVREASFAFGAERGQALRDRHLAEGIPINLATMDRTLNGVRDPLNAIFSIRGESYFSEGVSMFDCTYCPLAEVWAEEGAEGLALGYLFDMELHRGLVETFHPGAVIKWDALKTRGDSVCRFRFSIPELTTPEEREILARDGDFRRAGRVVVPQR